METSTLTHHGVKGMKWGVRKERSNSGGILGRMARRKGNPTVGMLDATYKPKKPKAELVVDKDYGKPKESPSSGLIRGAKTAHISDRQLQATINRIKMDAEYAKLTRSGFQKFVSRVGDKLAAEAAGMAAGLISKTARQYLDQAVAASRAGKSAAASAKSKPSGSPPKAPPNLPAQPKPPKPSGGGGGSWFKRRWSNMSSEFKRTWNGPTATTRDTRNRVYDQYGDFMFERGSVINPDGRNVKPRKR